MALTKCKECGHEISKSASACPSCGAKIKRTSIFTFVLLIILGLGFVSFIANSPSSSPIKSKAYAKPAAEKKPLFTIDKSAEKQSARKALLEELIAKGVFVKIDSSGDVWVDGTFRSIDYETKQSFLEVVYCYYHDGKSLGDAVYLNDYYTGKEIGSYTPLLGLKLK